MANGRRTAASAAALLGALLLTPGAAQTTLCSAVNSSLAAPIPNAFQAHTWDGPFSEPTLGVAGRVRLAFTNSTYAMTPYDVSIGGVPANNIPIPVLWQCANNTPSAVSYDAARGLLNVTAWSPDPQLGRPATTCLTFQLAEIANGSTLTPTLYSGQTADYDCVPYVPIASADNVTVVEYTVWQPSAGAAATLVRARRKSGFSPCSQAHAGGDALCAALSRVAPRVQLQPVVPPTPRAVVLGAAEHSGALSLRPARLGR
jgi:hypothetical protein